MAQQSKVFGKFFLQNLLSVTTCGVFLDTRFIPYIVWAVGIDFIFYHFSSSSLCEWSAQGAEIELNYLFGL